MRGLHVASAWLLVSVGVVAVACAACATGDGSTPDTGDGQPNSGADSGAAAPAPTTTAASVDSGAPTSDAGWTVDSGDAGSTVIDTLDANRNRILATYLAYLKANATSPQSNGLSQSNVTDVCSVWTKVDSSSRTVFLTLTARMQGSQLRNGTSVLSHVQKLYRVMGGNGATATDPGSCGGGEYNRMIMSMDTTLHDALLAANNSQGQADTTGQYDISDVPGTNSAWRSSQDVGGPHTPFDLSTETISGAPRGQTQFFQDTTSEKASAPLGRMDLTSLVDPLALELDQDYDCPHNSNPLCSYTSYGPLCTPEPAAVGVDIYAKTYGDPGQTWKPQGCN